MLGYPFPRIDFVDVSSSFSCFAQSLRCRYVQAHGLIYTSFSSLPPPVEEAQKEHHLCTGVAKLPAGPGAQKECFQSAVGRPHPAERVRPVAVPHQEAPSGW